LLTKPPALASEDPAHLVIDGKHRQTSKEPLQGGLAADRVTIPSYSSASEMMLTARPADRSVVSRVVTAVTPLRWSMIQSVSTRWPVVTDGPEDES
jgi:hypothetical protein